MLPKNEKVNRDGTQGLKIWVYGQPNIGKTTFANQFPDTIMLNTDGNYKYVDSPVITIGGNSPWEDFCNITDELLEGSHTYKTIVVDLVEDIYQYERNHYYKKLKIDHEADLGTSKGYDIIKNAYLIVLRKLANSGYNLIFLSHEKEIIVKDRIGRETTVFKPNITDSVAIKISGMVDITARLFSRTLKNEEDGSETEQRVLFFGPSSDVVTGNKIKSLKVDQIVMSENNGYNDLIKAIAHNDLIPKIEPYKKGDTNTTEEVVAVIEKVEEPIKIEVDSVSTNTEPIIKKDNGLTMVSRKKDK